MKSRIGYRRLILLIVLLALPGLACGLTGGDEEATAVVPGEGEGETREVVSTDTPAPTATPSPTPEPVTVAPELGDLSDLGSALEGFGSYRLTVEMSFSREDSETPEGSFRVETAVVGEPPASRTTTISA